MVDKVHHVQVLCKNIEKTLNTFQHKFGFKLHYVVKPDRAVKRSYVLKQECMWLILCEGEHDTVCNIAFEVKDVHRLLNKFDEKDVLQRAKTTQDINGHVVSAVVKTPVGNVVHSLLNLSEYYGDFLPGYIKCVDGEENAASETGATHYDHITYACYCDTSLEIISWYEKYFGFSRFFINDSEDTQDGYVVQSTDNSMASFGMRLTAMEFWKCSEIGLKICGKGSKNDIKLVLAEPLPGQGPNQVRNFLSEHGGPGVQHIGLHTNNIINSVTILKEKQVDFITPPNTYYFEVGKQEEAESLGVPFEQLVQLGILLDSDEDVDSRTDGHTVDKLFNSSKKRYLMQVFTRPLFDKETFFLELIQRCGATGFGAGNIRALWRAIDAHLQNVK